MGQSLFYQDPRTTHPSVNVYFDISQEFNRFTSLILGKMRGLVCENDLIYEHWSQRVLDLWLEDDDDDELFLWYG